MQNTEQVEHEEASNKVPKIKLRLRYVLTFLIFVAAGLSFQYGYMSNEVKPTPVEACVLIIVEDMRAHAAMRRALRSTEAEIKAGEYQ